LILFVVNQIAGAEYLLPLLRNWKRKKSYTIFATEASQDILKKNEIEFVPFSAAASANDVSTMLGKASFDHVVLSTSMSNSVELLFVEELRRRKIPTTQFIDTWSNYLERFTKTNGEKNSQIYPDAILTMNEASKAEMRTAGINIEVNVIGQPHLEATMANPLFGFDSSGPLLAASQPISQIYSKSLGYDQFDFADGLNELSREICLLIHPSESIETYRLKYSDRFSLMRLEDLKGSKYSGCIGMFSSVMVQAALLGIPTLSFQPKATDANKCGLSRLGFIQRVLDVADLENEISKTLAIGQTSCDAIKSEIVGSLRRLEDYLSANRLFLDSTTLHHSV
jgi:hypothetical protein